MSGYTLQAIYIGNGLATTYNGTNVANPIYEDNIIGDAKQIQLTYMRASAVEL